MLKVETGFSVIVLTGFVGAMVILLIPSQLGEENIVRAFAILAGVMQTEAFGFYLYYRNRRKKAIKDLKEHIGAIKYEEITQK